MKIIALTNWSLLGAYAILVIYLALTLPESGSDPAGRGLAVGYLPGGVGLLVALFGLNLLPFRFTRMAVLVAALVPFGVGLREAASRFYDAQQLQQTERGRWDGSFYFREPDQLRIAEAIAANDVVQLRTLLAEAFLLNESGEEHITLLDFATLRAVGSENPAAHLPLLELLLENGALIETDDTLHTPTHALVARQSPAVLLEWFLKKGADPNARHCRKQDIPVLFAVLDDPKDRVKKVELLLEHGADPNSIYPPTAPGWLAGHPVLLAAARQDLWGVCRALLKHGADATVAGPQKLTFRGVVAQRGKTYAETGAVPADFVALQKSLNNLPNGNP
ncbi:hypothetical protein ACFPMF_25925 [Larkinella bovis]|uniref:Ankyrin repeat domain-containing protein n=1 Tax=Larkinella bovis TaxID=683041 RepID=A0ABW0IKA3_9BACT